MDARAGIEQAAELLAKGETLSAVSILHQWTQDHPADRRAWELRGQAHMVLQQWTEAEYAACRAARLAPASARTQSNWGTALRKVGRLAEARRAQECALRLRPDYPRARDELRKLAGERPVGAAHTPRKTTGSSADAGPSPKRPSPQELPATLQPATAWRVQRAQSAISASDWSEAIKQLGFLLAEQPQNAEWRSWLAQTLELGGRHEEAFAQWKYIHDTAGTTGVQARYRACGLIAAARQESHRRYSDAIMVYEQLLQTFPGDPELARKVADAQRARAVQVMPHTGGGYRCPYCGGTNVQVRQERQLDAWLWVVIIVFIFILWPVIFLLPFLKNKQHYTCPDCGMRWSAEI